MPWKTKEARKKYYEKNKNIINERKKEIRAEFREWFLDLTKEKKCAICGENHPACLDYHHIDTKNKKFEIGELAWGRYSKKVVLEELEKCKVLCSNCHRKLHWGDNSFGKTGRYPSGEGSRL
ncbi:hypothetical protein CL614_00255 [archaeon]|nr:hypothetical protein [archaeon]|tara:strand:+ start:398 stop:763 length:366 start_codon:yes stop_codon:yes gene_type:complete